MYQQLIQKHIEEEVETDSEYHGLDQYSIRDAAVSLDTIIKNDLITKIEEKSWKELFEACIPIIKS